VQVPYIKLLVSNAGKATGVVPDIIQNIVQCQENKTIIFPGIAGFIWLMGCIIILLVKV